MIYRDGLLLTIVIFLESLMFIAIIITAILAFVLEQYNIFHITSLICVVLCVLIFIVGFFDN